MASTGNSVARTLHDLGLAGWFGGSLMGAAGVNGAAAVVQDPTQRLRVANSGWARWTPLNLAGMVAHLTGGAVLVVPARMGEQQRPAQVTGGLVRRLLQAASQPTSA